MDLLIIFDNHEIWTRQTISVQHDEASTDLARVADDWNQAIVFHSSVDYLFLTASGWDRVSEPNRYDLDRAVKVERFFALLKEFLILVEERATERVKCDQELLKLEELGVIDLVMETHLISGGELE